MTAENQAKLQYTFDNVAAHMLTQGRRSMNTIPSITGKISATGCAYRGKDGERCGVGFCIPNHKYIPELEGIGLTDDYVLYAERFKQQLVLDAIGDEYCNDHTFLGKIQTIHDRFNAEDWAYHLGELAKDYKLDESILDTFESITIPQPQALVYAD